ncbi:MAG: hypothetical protein JNM63_00435, partial [Spirochaetia bacterium]|nr:hypothetical protein [Spirochaetia bacterium]
MSFKYQNTILHDKAFLHVVIRDISLGDASTLNSINLYGLEPMAEKRFKVRLPSKGNHSIIFFMKGRGVALVDDINIQEGDGTVTLLAREQAAPAKSQPDTLPKVSPDFFIERPARRSAPTLSVADFGAATAATNNYGAFTRALEVCRVQGASHLLIPPGRYFFDSMEESLVLTNLSHLTIDGQGSELVFFRQRMRYGQPFIQINACDHLAIQNLFIDWDWDRTPLASVVRIEAVDAAGAWIDCRLTEAPRIRPNNLRPRVLEALDPKTFQVGVEGGRDFWEAFEDAMEWREPSIARL